jgi:hypothetical protein
MRKLFTLGAMILSLFSFFIFVLTSMPGGALLFAGSLVLLIFSSEWAAERIHDLRARFNALNKSMIWLEDKMGERSGSVLRSTRPGNEIDNSMVT